MDSHAAHCKRRNVVLAACVTAAAAMILAVTVFDVPVSSVFFFAMVALCPLMHLFMGHGAHGHQEADGTTPKIEPVSQENDSASIKKYS
ncbi:MAG: DUF2933 domain-containing protein [Candidatus Aquicultorales bacterium]